MNSIDLKILDYAFCELLVDPINFQQFVNRGMSDRPHSSKVAQ
jgi:hypothetical protein